MPSTAYVTLICAQIPERIDGTGLGRRVDEPPPKCWTFRSAALERVCAIALTVAHLLSLMVLEEVFE